MFPPVRYHDTNADWLDTLCSIELVRKDITDKKWRKELLSPRKNSNRRESAETVCMARKRRVETWSDKQRRPITCQATWWPA